MIFIAMQPTVEMIQLYNKTTVRHGNWERNEQSKISLPILRNFRCNYNLPSSPVNEKVHTHTKFERIPFNCVVGSFHTKKLCSRLA